MKVLVVHNRYRSAQPSGENQVAVDEVAALRSHGVEVDTVTVDSDEIATWPIRKRALLPGRVVWSFEGARLVRESVRQVRPDVVHFHNTFPLISPAGLRAAKAGGARVVKTLHNYRPLCPAGSLFRDGHVCEECLGRAPVPSIRHACYRGSRTATLPVAVSNVVHQRSGTWQHAVDAFIAPSGFTRGRYVAAGWPAERIVVKYNMVPEPGIRRHGVGSGFLCLTRLSAEKGVGELLEAWSQAFPDGGEGLTVVGAGELEDDLRRSYSDVPGVRFLGQVPREEVLRQLASARAVVVPSIWYEVFGRTAAEAAAMEVPVLASRLGGLPEVVHDGTTGLLFDPRVPGELVGVLHRLAADDELCLELGRAGRRLFEAQFSVAVTTDRLIGIYRRVMGAAPRTEVERMVTA